MAKTIGARLAALETVARAGARGDRLRAWQERAAAFLRGEMDPGAYFAGNPEGARRWAEAGASLELAGHDPAEFSRQEQCT